MAAIVMALAVVVFPTIPALEEVVRQGLWTRAAEWVGGTLLLWIMLAAAGFTDMEFSTPFGGLKRTGESEAGDAEERLIEKLRHENQDLQRQASTIRAEVLGQETPDNAVVEAVDRDA
jgi:hypothetical protein